MTPAELADLHARAFTVPRPYTEQEFARFLNDPICFLTWLGTDGFALGRLIGEEAELLTIAVDPGQRRQGLGRAILKDFETTASLRGAQRIFLEVAATNTPAITLYESAGYTQVGTRPGYYKTGASRVDAVILSRII